MRHPSKRPARGFTLVELLVVMAIISILMVFILAAASQGAQEARRQATISLIAKLDTGLTDRIQAILSQRVDPIQSHYDMAYIYQTQTNPYDGNSVPYVPIGSKPNPLAASGGGPEFLPPVGPGIETGRAQTIATFDLYRAEMPDVFFVQPVATQYPLNFAQQPYPGLAAPFSYALPLGVSNYLGSPGIGMAAAKPTGMYGASFTAAAGLYKNLGNIPGAPNPYLRTGVDGTDNNGNGLVDEYSEGTNGTNSTSVTQSLSNHQHNTARAEMLYALLIESDSPYLSAMNRDDFTDTEVGDTDGDGLPEFLDAWGNPIYFYRWPIFYHSDVQKGVDPYSPVPGPYLSVTQAREVDSLDPNQMTLSPAWWSGASNMGPSASYFPTNASTGVMSGPAYAFQNFFHQLVEPLSSAGTPQPAYYWDRGTLYFQRRAFFSKPLIISSGPDGLLGLPVLTNSTISSLGSTISMAQAVNLEGQAAPFNLYSNQSPNRIQAMPTAAGLYGQPLNILYNTDTPPIDLYQLQGQDDISNHTTQASGGSTQ